MLVFLSSTSLKETVKRDQTGASRKLINSKVLLIKRLSLCFSYISLAKIALKYSHSAYHRFTIRFLKNHVMVKEDKTSHFFFFRVILSLVVKN